MSESVKNRGGRKKKGGIYSGDHKRCARENAKVLRFSDCEGEAGVQGRWTGWERERLKWRGGCVMAKRCSSLFVLNGLGLCVMPENPAGHYSWPSLKGNSRLREKEWGVQTLKPGVGGSGWMQHTNQTKHNCGTPREKRFNRILATVKLRRKCSHAYVIWTGNLQTFYAANTVFYKGFRCGAWKLKEVSFLFAGKHKKKKRSNYLRAFKWIRGCVWMQSCVCWDPWAPYKSVCVCVCDLRFWQTK